jgi:adenosylcobinamide kinase / adenosylcobinamide-phosphate guanylyltransferase
VADVVLVLGGARSGKSEVAERRATALAAGAPVTYVATGWAPDGSDADWAGRVAAHQARRPAGWVTVEAGEDLPDVLEPISGVALVDSLGTWVSGVRGFAADADGLVDVLARRTTPTVLVSDEVGLGVHPETLAGVAFRDALGEVNCRVAEVAGEVLLVVAGRTLRLE